MDKLPEPRPMDIPRLRILFTEAIKIIYPNPEDYNKAHAYLESLLQRVEKQEYKRQLIEELHQILYGEKLFR